MNRRTFIGTTTAAALMSRFGWSASDHHIEKVGVQLYTVRDLMKEDFDGTLAKVASIGYREVEFAGYFGHSPKEVRAALDQHGLTAPSAHIDYKTTTSNLDEAIESAKVIGHDYLVNPMIDEDVRKQPDGWPRAAEAFNRAGEKTQKAKIQFAYHNHYFEFLPLPDKQLPYDILLKECDSKLVKMEMDLCWITVGGQDPVKYFAKYPGRFPLVHVKGLKQLPKPAPGHEITFEDVFPVMSSVGEGPIDWKRIFSHSEQAGIKHYFVEHDQPKSPFENIQASYTYLKDLRF